MIVHVSVCYHSITKATIFTNRYHGQTNVQWMFTFVTCPDDGETLAGVSFILRRNCIEANSEAAILDNA